MRRSLHLLVLISVIGMSLPVIAQVEGARIQRLIELLSDQDFRVRLQATIVLGRLKDRRSVPALITALGDTNPLVRGMAGHALGLIGDTRAVSPLKKLLRDRHPLTRKRAKFALEMIHRQNPQQKEVPRRSPVLIHIASIGDKTKRGKALLPELRRLWQEQIERSPGLQLAAHRNPARNQRFFEVTSSITDLSLRKRGGVVETSCSVSVVVGDRNGSIIMMTSGGATVEVDSRQYRPGRETVLQVAALESAIMSVHTNLLRFIDNR